MKLGATVNNGSVGAATIALAVGQPQDQPPPQTHSLAATFCVQIFCSRFQTFDLGQPDNLPIQPSTPRGTSNLSTAERTIVILQCVTRPGAEVLEEVGSLYGCPKQALDSNATLAPRPFTKHFKIRQVATENETTWPQPASTSRSCLPTTSNS